eukprot:11248811-Prorocentrum_lima.AAC.1
MEGHQDRVHGWMQVNQLGGFLFCLNNQCMLWEVLFEEQASGRQAHHRAEVEASEMRQPVSYTHLTLPTICSV